MIHDVAIAGLPVTICVDRAGIVGEDGETHQGVFDIAFLKTIPGIKIYSPSGYLEVRMNLQKSVNNELSPTVIRYPRGSGPELPEDFVPSNENFQFYGDPSAKSIIITFGRTFSAAAKCYKTLKEQGIKVAVLKLNRVYPVDEKIYDSLKRFSKIFIFEEDLFSCSLCT